MSILKALDTEIEQLKLVSAKLEEYGVEAKDIPKFVAVQLVHVPYHTSFRFGRRWWHKTSPTNIVRDDGEMASIKLNTLVAVIIGDFPNQKINLTKPLN